MKSLRFLALLAALVSPLLSVSAESVAEIMKAIEQEKAAALTAYLEANPDAADRAEALGFLVEAQTFLGNDDTLVPLLEQRYAAATKGSAADLGDLFGRIVQPLVQSYLASGQKDKAREFIDKVKTDTKDHAMAAQIGQFLDQLGGGLDKPSVGGTLEIAFDDIDGKKFDLAKMQGKVVLVDFWATWCGPCVQEMPHVTAAYKKFHDKGFEVVGISLDSDEGALREFIKKNEMPWPQYFDGKGWQNELAGKFGIRSIPATFLIGKDGKIAAADLRGGALEAKLKELLD